MPSFDEEERAINDQQHLREAFLSTMEKRYLRGFPKHSRDNRDNRNHRAQTRLCISPLKGNSFYGCCVDATQALFRGLNKHMNRLYVATLIAKYSDR